MGCGARSCQSWNGGGCSVQKLASFPEFFCPPGIELSEICHFGILQVVHNLVSIAPEFCVVTSSFCTSVESIPSPDVLNQPLS